MWTIRAGFSHPHSRFEHHQVHRGSVKDTSTETGQIFRRSDIRCASDFPEARSAKRSIRKNRDSSLHFITPRDHRSRVRLAHRKAHARWLPHYLALGFGTKGAYAQKQISSEAGMHSDARRVRSVTLRPSWPGVDAVNRPARSPIA